MKAGHGCVGCTMPRFWDQMSPFYRRLSNPPGFAVDVTADQIGLGLVGVVSALSVAHGTVSYVRGRSGGGHEPEGELTAADLGPAGPAPDETVTPPDETVTSPPDTTESQEVS